MELLDIHTVINEMWKLIKKYEMTELNDKDRNNFLKEATVVYEQHKDPFTMGAMVLAADELNRKYQQMKKEGYFDPHNR